MTPDLAFKGRKNAVERFPRVRHGFEGFRHRAKCDRSSHEPLSETAYRAYCLFDFLICKFVGAHGALSVKDFQGVLQRVSKGLALGV